MTLPPPSRVLPVLLLGLALTACSLTGDEPAIPGSAPETPVSPSAPVSRDLSLRPFSKPDARHMFARGYVAVASRYIEPVNLADFVVAGLRGLTSLDARLDARIVGATVEVLYDGRRVAAFDRPDQDHGGAWADLTLDAVQAARAVSPDLASADAEALYDALFDAALASLDPFSRYAGAEEARLNRGSRNGFGGIGIVFDVSEDGIVRVEEVVRGAPAEAAGLRAGDRIVSVDGRPLERADMTLVRNLLRGPVGASVRLGVDRGGQRLSVTIRRGLIVMPTVELTFDGDIAVMRVSSFNQATTEAVAEAVRAARRQAGAGAGPAAGPRGLIIDMRGNPGGLLDQSVTMADLFLDGGTIVSTRGRHPEARQYYSATGGDVAGGLPIVVLMDGESASAAEIVAAALQDGGRAVVIGTTSYGKGTVQTVIQLPNGGEITLTWSRFHSPSGYVLHGLGVPPVACTSGRADQTGPRVVDSVLEDLRTHALHIARRLSSWQHTAYEDTERRRQLRALCPAEPHEINGLDEVVARRLIADPGLYARAVGLVRANAALRP
ncbi:S41 family peptidase [Roseospira visakhapatnamensis]|uniref:Carboxyl-terminal processing protease n=1 Tax=Roseospira visakhapatnamensis TaxID=390880 RepID=A0A7W6W8A7_9PROT|nr:S41 family peptidase [Roseospira visakhapatnamensis]MBB4264603.1 carboxyl-terminal processing protease [Roseospira visakhapatnamensis]